jgi:hypothetical protein
MDCTQSASGPDTLATIGFYAVALAVVATIVMIRRRWSAREAAGEVRVAFWWEAIVHALAVSAVLVVGLAMVVGFLLRNGF